jgi:hypothetical protein
MGTALVVIPVGRFLQFDTALWEGLQAFLQHYSMRFNPSLGWQELGIG